jgi:hypothetical protein
VFVVLDRMRAPTRAERLHVMASTPEAERLIGGAVPAWSSPALRDGVGVYGPATLYHAGREYGVSSAIMQRRLTKFLDPAAPVATQRWWEQELQHVVATEKRLPKLRPNTNA